VGARPVGRPRPQPVLEGNQLPWKALGRPANLDRIVYAFGNSLDSTLLRLRRNDTDLGSTPPSVPSQLASEFGINKGRFFVRQMTVTWYLALNTSRPLFRNNVQLRQAVNWALDRPQMVRQHGFLAGGRTDQILPPGMPGFKDRQVYSLKGVNPASLAKATALARGRTRGGKAVFYAFTAAPSSSVAQVVQFNLKRIGIDVEIKQFERPVQHEKAGTRGEPFDIVHEAWSADYPDPSSFLNVLLDGRGSRSRTTSTCPTSTTPATTTSSRRRPGRPVPTVSRGTVRSTRTSCRTAHRWRRTWP
jgi:ABC-type oligopeptide transport system substrate-binding subunit